MRESIILLCVIGMMLCVGIAEARRRHVTCSSRGDPKYDTFDGKVYFFSGKCQYYLIKGNSPKFHVVQADGPCRRGRDTCPKNLTITSANEKVVVLHRGGSVTVEGSEVVPPYQGFGYNITKNGREVTVEGFNYIVIYDGRNNIEVLADDPSRKNKVRGLCGDFDGNSTNDFQTDDDIFTDDAFIFGNSYRTDKNCLGVCATAPCLNGGTCIQENSMFKCQCPPGTIGDTCELPPTPCEPSPCKYNGTCTFEGTVASCQCPIGYFGKHCDDFSAPTYYLGCYVDRPDRAFAGRLADSVNMTIPKCLRECIAENYTIAGLEYGRECFCGDATFSRHGLAPEGDDGCDFECPGDPAWQCGGLWRASVWTVPPGQ